MYTRFRCPQALWHDQKTCFTQMRKLGSTVALGSRGKFYTDLGSHVCCYYHCSSVKRYLITHVEIAGISKRTHTYIYIYKHQSPQSTRIGHLLQQ